MRYLDSASDPSAESLSQQAHRRLIGVLGFLLPFLVYIFAGLLPTAGLPSWKLLSSVSAYYYTGGGAVFIGVVFGPAPFLPTHPRLKRGLAPRPVGFWGGAAPVAVTPFSTTPPAG